MPRSWPPFFRAVGAPYPTNFTIIAPLLCPPFSNVRMLENFSIFSLVLVKISALKMQIFQIFRSLDPSFFKENPLPRPYFCKPVWHIPTKKKVECPPPRELSLRNHVLPGVWSLTLISSGRRLSSILVWYISLCVSAWKGHEEWSLWSCLRLEGVGPGVFWSSVISKSMNTLKPLLSSSRSWSVCRVGEDGGSSSFLKRSSYEIPPSSLVGNLA